MVAAVLKASAVGVWSSYAGIPSGHSSRCSTWVSQLNPEPAIRRVDNVASRFVQRWPLASSESGLSGSFRGNRLGWKLGALERSTRTRTVRVSASQGDTSDSLPDPPDGIELDPSIFQEQSFQKAKAAYTQPVNPDDFKGAPELMAAYKGQKVLGKLVHERMELEKLVAEGGPVVIWNWMKRAQGMLGAVALTVVMLMHMPGPPRPPVMRDVAPHRRSVSAAAPRRGRNAKLRGTPLNEHVSPMEVFPQAIFACTALAMVTHLLRKNACDQTPRLVQMEPKVDLGMTAFHLHLAISGFACSLRYDLDEVSNQLDMLGRVQRPETLKTVAPVLMRHLEHIVYAGIQVEHPNNSTASRTFINNWDYADASHIRLAPTKEMLQKVSKGYGRKLPEDTRLLIDSYNAGYTVVTLSGEVRGQLPFRRVNDSLDLHKFLACLEKLDPANVQHLRVKWTPTTGETLPEELMLTYFPHMTLLAEPAELV